jgi:uncharacterized protein (TIGR01777 family)
MKILMTGSHGFVGSALKSHLEAKGHEFTSSGPCDVVINLAGENIFGFWSRKKKRKIKESRLKTTQNLYDIPHACYIGASAVGYYGKGFLAEVCHEWERAALPLQERGVRVVYARLGIVLDKKGGALRKMLVPSILGRGTQRMSWVSLEDVVCALEFLMENKEAKGPYDIVAGTVTNSELAKTLGEVLHRPVFRVPAFILKLLMGKEAAEELFLNDSVGSSEKLRALGFKFKDDDLKNFLLHNLSFDS